MRKLSILSFSQIGWYLFKPCAAALKFRQGTHLAKFQGHSERSKYYLIWLKLHMRSYLICTTSQANKQFKIRQLKVDHYKYHPNAI